MTPTQKLHLRRTLLVSAAIAAGLAVAASFLSMDGRAGDPALPGDALRARLEAYLGAQRERLMQYPGHAVLVLDLPQDRLLAFADRLRCHPDGEDWVLGAAHAPESYGGAVLALLLDAWRPEGRSARLDDRFPFRGVPSPVPLAEIHASHRRQIFLPVPGLEPDDLAGALPQTPQLPRMRFRHPSSQEIVERASYPFLRILIDHPGDRGVAWTNHLGQRLDPALLMAHVRDVYLQERSPDRELSDHTRLHSVLLLLADHRQGGAVDAAAIQERFVATELERRSFDALETEVVAHYAQSLGALLATPGLDWPASDARRVREWLAWVEEGLFADLDAVPIQHLAHLLHGLRAVHGNREKLL